MAKVEHEVMPDATVSTEIGIDLGVIPVEMNGEHITFHRADRARTAHVYDSEQGFAVVTFIGDSEHGQGFYVAMTPDRARMMAAGILRSADAAEQGYGAMKQ